MKFTLTLHKINGIFTWISLNTNIMWTIHVNCSHEICVKWTSHEITFMSCGVHVKLDKHELNGKIFAYLYEITLFCPIHTFTLNCLAKTHYLSNKVHHTPERQEIYQEDFYLLYDTILWKHLLWLWSKFVVILLQIENLLSNIGGTLGLWIGMSVISIGEVVELLLILCRTARKNKSKRYVTRPVVKD